MNDDKIHAWLSEVKRQGLYRQRQLFPANLLQFSSNDYLALTHDPQIKKAYQLGMEKYPIGSGASMVISGYHTMHQALEQEFSAALQVDAGLLFSSGYTANLSIAALLATLAAPVLIDKAVHASIYDGLIGAKVPFIRFKHQDLQALSQQLSRTSSSPIVLTESIFSMSGQQSTLDVMAKQLQPYGGQMIVDEAHAFGVIGPEGLGSVFAQQLTPEEVPLRMIPFGKACAGLGAIVVGKQHWIDALLQSARPTIYSTAMSPAMAYGLLHTVDYIRTLDDRRHRLQAIIAYFREKIASSPLRWRDSSTAIQQLQLGCPEKAMATSTELRQHHILCMAIRQPTVNKQETGLRIVLNCQHEPQDIDRLLAVLHAGC